MEYITLNYSGKKFRINFTHKNIEGFADSRVLRMGSGKFSKKRAHRGCARFFSFLSLLSRKGSVDNL